MRKLLLVVAGVVAAWTMPAIDVASAGPASSLVAEGKVLGDEVGLATVVQYSDRYDLCSAPLVYDSTWQCYLPSYLANRLP